MQSLVSQQMSMSVSKTSRTPARALTCVRFSVQAWSCLAQLPNLSSQSVKIWQSRISRVYSVSKNINPRPDTRNGWVQKRYTLLLITPIKPGFAQTIAHKGEQNTYIGLHGPISPFFEFSLDKSRTKLMATHKETTFVFMVLLSLFESAW